jgi:hypothetical protein
MTSYQVMLAHPKELNIVLICKCGTRITTLVNGGVPEYCPTWRKLFDIATKQVFVEFDKLLNCIELSREVEFQFQIGSTSTSTSGHVS